jgi:excisionase family DNA binding protein
MQDAVGPLPKFLSRDQTAEWIGVSTRTLSRMVAAGEFPSPLRLRSKLRWPEDAVRNWMDAKLRDFNARNGLASPAAASPVHPIKGAARPRVKVD